MDCGFPEIPHARLKSVFTLNFMSQTISWLIEAAILPGKLQDFEAVGAELLKLTEAEPGTLCHEWFITDDQTTYQVYARFKDSDAVLAHIEIFSPFVERLLESSMPVSFQVYGTPSEKVQDLLAAYQPVYFEKVHGFHR